MLYPSSPHTHTHAHTHTQFNHNKVDQWSDLDQLAPAVGLKTVYFEGNPMASDPQYRRKVKLALPTLTQIDATLVSV